MVSNPVPCIVSMYEHRTEHTVSKGAEIERVGGMKAEIFSC